MMVKVDIKNGKRSINIHPKIFMSDRLAKKVYWMDFVWIFCNLPNKNQHFIFISSRENQKICKQSNITILVLLFMNTEIP